MSDHELLRVGVAPGGLCTVSCSCGWRTSARITAGMAASLFDDHVREQAGEPAAGAPEPTL